jgi:hypothetical protein
LDFYGTKIWTPYRINIPFQPDRRRYGKESAKRIRLDTIEIAKEHSFDLKEASAEEIGDFMRQQLLGIDCSGYVYQLLDSALATQKSTMEKLGFPKASSTNVALLTSAQYAKKMTGLAKDVRVGDLIKFGADELGIMHVLIVISKSADKIIYGHSSAFNSPDGVGLGEISITNPDKSIKVQHWHDILSSGENRGALFNPDRGDGVYRLSAIKLSDDTD